MIRTIEGFHEDDAGDWVAELSCLHSQHIRHRPPFFDRPWVVTSEGRAARLGSDIDCPVCDRCELPDGLRVVRIAGPFDEASVPPALLRDHRVGERTWGKLRVLAGHVALNIATDPRLRRQLRANQAHPIPPTVLHSVAPGPHSRFEIEFLAR